MFHREKNLICRSALAVLALVAGFFFLLRAANAQEHHPARGGDAGIADTVLAMSSVSPARSAWHHEALPARRSA